MEGSTETVKDLTRDNNALPGDLEWVLSFDNKETILRDGNDSQVGLYVSYVSEFLGWTCVLFQVSVRTS